MLNTHTQLQRKVSQKISFGLNCRYEQTHCSSWKARQRQGKVVVVFLFFVFGGVKTSFSSLEHRSEISQSFFHDKNLNENGTETISDSYGIRVT